MKNLFDEVTRLYAMKHIIRYNNIAKIQTESVAEHSYFVVLITARLHMIYDFDLERALLMAAVHDIFEVYIGDVPRNIKQRFSKIDYAMDEIETEVIKEKYPEYLELLHDFNYGISAAAKAVKLADNLSVYQYALTETELGNKHYMPEILEKIKIDIQEQLKSLEVFKRE